MNCLQADGLIQGALDGALTAREREALDAHLADCAGCQGAWDEYRRLARTATVWTRRPIHEADLGEEFTAQVMAQIASRPSVPDHSPVSVWQRLALAGIVLAALFVCGLLFPLPAVPISPPPDLLPHPQAAIGLPAWLWSNLSGLPAAMGGLWQDLTAGLSVSGTMVWLLTAAVACNGLLYARIVRRARGPVAR